MSDVVKYNSEDDIAWITISRPEALNAIDAAVAERLWACFRQAEADSKVRVIVLTGEGSRAFCAGADIKEMSRTGMKADPHRYPHANVNMNLAKPLIGAINGLAYGGGFLLAQMCDLLVAAETATFAISEARIGRGAPWAAPLSWLIPPKVAMQILMTGEPISARRAYEIGFVNLVVALPDLIAATRELASKIGGNAPLSVRAAKKLVYETAHHGWQKSVHLGHHIYAPVYESHDAQIGPKAFAEKRKPQWTGS
jgi:enoyl-CoA hydratase/carnithine racemase